jgi:hypothetical protein
VRPVYQVVLGLLLAIGLLVALQWWVNPDLDLKVEPATDHLEDRVVDVGVGSRRILRDMDGLAEGFDLATRAEDLPPGCAPVLEIRPGGVLRIVTPAPLSRSPGSLRWPKVGLLLPRAELAELSASERASLLAVWSRLSGGRKLRTSAIRMHGCQAHPEEVPRLLRWLR